MEEGVELRFKKQPEIFKQVKPILYADINIGERGMFRIAVHKGDSPGKLADEFS